MSALMICSLAGVGFQDLDERLRLEDIDDEPILEMETGKRPGHGQYPINDYTPTPLELRTITLTFMVKEHNRAERAAILQKVSGWASCGYFTCSTHPGQRIYVVCTKLPRVKTFKWHERMTVVFTAYGEACWEETSPTQLITASATNAGSTTFKPNGNRRCFLEAEIKNVSSSALTSITLSANGESIVISEISIPKNGTVVLGYDAWHRMTIKYGSASLLDKRSGDDDIHLKAGVANAISCVTNVACRSVLTGRGLWR